MKIKLDGARQLDAALAELKTATAKRLVRKVLTAAAEPIRQAAEDRAPARPGDAPAHFMNFDGKRHFRRPGTLEAMVQIGSSLTRRQASLARKEGPTGVNVYVGTRDPVGRLVEFGTASAAASPFLRPAFEGYGEQALTIIMQKLGEDIEAARQRAERLALKAKG